MDYPKNKAKILRETMIIRQKVDFFDKVTQNGMQLQTTQQQNLQFFSKINFYLNLYFE